jgi:hypothetical protein
LMGGLEERRGRLPFEVFVRGEFGYVFEFELARA